MVIKTTQFPCRPHDLGFKFTTAQPHLLCTAVSVLHDLEVAECMGVSWSEALGLHPLEWEAVSWGGQGPARVDIR